MGLNSSKRLAAKCSFLSKDEQVIVSNSFRLASKNSERIKEDELTVCVFFYTKVFYRVSIITLLTITL